MSALRRFRGLKYMRNFLRGLSGLPGSLARLRSAAKRLPLVVQMAAAVVTLMVAAGLPSATLLRGALVGNGGEGEQPGLAVLARNSPYLGPRYFDVTQMGVDVVEGGHAQYDVGQFDAILREGDQEKIRTVGIGPDAIFSTSFTVSNTSDRERVIITGVGFQIDEFTPPPDGLRLGCPPARAPEAEVQNVIYIEMQLDAEKVGLEQLSKSFPKPGTVLEMGPNDLQAFSGKVQFSAPGQFRYRVLVYYDTSAGFSGRAVSDPVQTALMPTSGQLEGVASGPLEDCTPQEA